MIKINQKDYVALDKVVYIRRDSAGWPQITCNPQANLNRYNYAEDGWNVISEESFNLLIKEIK